MIRLTDQELIEELKSRFDINRKALHDLQAVTRQLEEMNRRLHDSEALKGHFLSNIRNEINNPLTAISGLARHLMNGTASAEQVAQIGGMIYAEAFDLDFQLRNIFIAAELEAGSLAPEFATVRLQELISGTVEMLGRHLLGRSLSVVETVEKDYDGPLQFVTDAQMLQLMLMNLLMNAIEYSHPGGRIDLQVTARGDGIVLRVADSGVGIDPADHHRIFDRFVQMETGTTRNHRGHGLGLCITRALVEMLGGRVEIESARGSGAAFTLILPVPQIQTPQVTARDGNFFLFTGDDEAQLF